MTAPMNIEPRKEHCTTPLHRKKLIWHGKVVLCTIIYPLEFYRRLLSFSGSPNGQE
ncbi:hypothetical protein FA13DRAFT_707286 [Coprinellus micaceus]|uniref:Uncharacterized protein n=1 Tax=Coprinellus micaceus TaxID=71717 RepID=A0A4Y7TV14_COPMI|nr:hypothetical protein FA13DRAFT_707286 [Coprinellus micaceus]